MSMAVLKVRLLGDPCLRAKSKPVNAVGVVERMLIAAMFETMESHKGIGLAAPQVGINQQIFVVDTGKEAFAAINPKIVKAVGGDFMEEGCLSIPDLHVNVKRAKTIWVEFTDEHNRLVSAEISGLTAKVFQHESDHLNGKLIIDYLPPAQQKKVLAQIKGGVYMPSPKEKNDDAR
jgi:peptide deformylase